MIRIKIISSFILFLIITSFTVNAQIKENNFNWNKRKLKWSDYYVKKITNSYYKAKTNHKIELKYIHQNPKKIILKICNVFLYKGSWVVKDNQNDYLLDHEQRHFDIGEIITRRLRKKLLETNFTKSNIKEINQITKKYFDEEKKLQSLYDKETNHSLNKDAQIKWDKLIDKQLKELDNYKECKIILFLK